MDDANSLIHLAKQMGLIDVGYYNHMPNATKCKTIKDIYRSHVNDLVILEVSDIYGMLILLALGLGGALVLFSSEGRWEYCLYYVRDFIVYITCCRLCIGHKDGQN